jgi:predicted acetyltransferase
MTTATAKRTILELAQEADLSELLREHYTLWGSGLTREDYEGWLRDQLRQPWTRRHFRYFVFRDGKQVVAGAKMYTLKVQARGRLYKVAGLGAIYTMKRYRGRGFGSKMTAALKALAEKEGCDALLLFSDIDPSFYEQSGFALLSDHEFYIWTNDPQIERQIMGDRSFVDDLHEHSPDMQTLDLNDVGEMVRHHQRYLVTAPFGIVRSEDYWTFKLQRDLYLQTHASTFRPTLEFLSMDLGSPAGGYAIFEQAGKIMRVLEVVGRPEAREILWRNLLRAALLRRISLIRGWESAAPTFVRGIKYITRDLARPMLLPLNDDTIGWLDASPCPLLELDHF